MSINCRLLIFVIGLILSVPAIARAENICPSLPVIAGVEWNYKEGPDFYICYAVKGTKQLFGLYLGNFPNFHPDQNATGRKGRIGGFDVVWYSGKSDDAAKPIKIQTILKISSRPEPTVDGPPPPPGGPEFAHIWINAANELDMVDVLKLVQDLKFKTTASP